MPSLMKSLGIDRLSVAERLELFSDLWDSIASAGDVAPLTKEQVADLNSRLDEDDADPYEGSSWEDVKRQIRGEGV